MPLSTNKRPNHQVVLKCHGCFHINHFGTVLHDDDNIQPDHLRQGILAKEHESSRIRSTGTPHYNWIESSLLNPTDVETSGSILSVMPELNNGKEA